MKSLWLRFFSAIIGLLIIATMVFFFHESGLRFICIVAVALATREGLRILFNENRKSPLVLLLGALTFFFVFLTSLLNLEIQFLFLSIIVALFLVLTLAFQSQFESLDKIFFFQAKGLICFFYLGVLPGFAVHTLALRHGLTWFFALLAFVFLNDTLAYLTGSKWGRRPLMPTISPKKSVEGALGGLFGSILAALLLSYWGLPHIPLVFLVPLAIIIGLAGQFGDLFESLLKRVANQKDSGSIMPGHGGVLDRIDGILFAAPLLYFGASLLEKWF